MPPLDYQSDVRRTQQSLSRAGWSVIQTGLITTALALFGVFVLASRINNVDAMDFYWPAGVPLGAAVVGAVAGSGYVAGSWWTGLRVRRWLLAAVLAIQCLAFVAAHYAEFSTLDLVYSDTKDPVQFWNFFHYATTTMTLGGDSGTWRGESLG